MIYFVQGTQTKRIKIGVSNHPVRELEKLQSAATEKLSILAVKIGGRYRKQDLHTRFKEYRLQGGWFEYDGDLQQYLEDLTHNDGIILPSSCKICCGMYFLANFSALSDEEINENIKSHSIAHSAIGKGAYPEEIREQIKDLGWVALAGKESIQINVSKDQAKRLIAYGLWARARQNGLPDKDFEDYILDHLVSLDTKDELVKNEIEQRWGKYG